MFEFDIRRLDLYRKVPKDLTQPTTTGAVVSICSVLMIVFLFVSEFMSFITPEMKSTMFVDPVSNQREQLRVRLNVSLPALSCDALGIDIQDELGRHEVGFQQNIKKTVLKDAGCNLAGEFHVNKVPGNFHLSTHSAQRQPAVVDMRHVVHELTFGDDAADGDRVEASFNPLKDVERIKDATTAQSHDYFLRCVPTIVQPLWGKPVHSYQFTYAYKAYDAASHGHRVVPAVWFRYDLSPITIKQEEVYIPFYHFITTVLAIVGGTFTVAGILDSLVFTASEVFKKLEIGKLN